MKSKKNNVNVNVKPGIRLAHVNVKPGIKLALLIVVVLMASLLLPGCSSKNQESKVFTTLEELEGCTFALSDSNSSYEQYIRNDIPGVELQRFTNYFDTFIAVANGTADAAFSYKYTFYGLRESYPDLNYVESSYQIPVVANFSNGNDELREDFNKFIAESKENGLLDQLAEKWMVGYDALTDDDIVDFSDLENNDGPTIKFAICDTNIPYEYLRNAKLAGYDPALFYEFCKARGYIPNVTVSTFDAVVAGIGAGKYDMAMSGYGYTEERSENSNFSDPYFQDTIVYTVNGISTSNGFIGNIQDSFERTFVKQNRWKLFAGGMLVTLMITVLSVLLGALIGFALFLLSRRIKWLQRFSYIVNDTLEALPVLVVLMIFFYVIFGSSDMSGVVVSVIVFGLTFAFSFFALISNSVRGVPRDQTEAGLALGYTDRQTLFKVVLPQAMEAFIPAIRSSIVATLKSTAIVGYVAVQDLTKAGDLIRSQTFEAFMPIITVALIYFALAKLLIFLLNKFLVTPSEKRRMRKEGR